MRKAIWGCIVICACVFSIQTGFAATVSQALAEPVQICVNLKGRYQLPLQKRERSDDPWTLIIDQDQCRLISVLVNEGGIIPISPDYMLDGTEGYYIVSNTIVRKDSDGSSFSFLTGHGQCSAKAMVLSLDDNKNLIASSNKVFACEDKYQGPYKETFPRIQGQTNSTTLPKVLDVTASDICESNGDCNGGRCTAAGACDNGGARAPCDSNSQCASGYCYASGTCR